MKTPVSSRRSDRPPTVAARPDRRPKPIPAPKLGLGRLNIRRILVPVDFSEPSRKALRYARPFAEQFGARLTLLHVMEPIIYPPELGYVSFAPQEAEDQRLVDLQAKLKQLAGELGATVPVQSVVRVGRAWKEIVDAARAQETDLIIVATHGYTGLQHALMGSVAEKVVRHAPCPALVVRTQERDFV